MKEDFKKEIRWEQPLRKNPEVLEIWKVSASIKKKKLAWTRPILIMEVFDLERKIWVEGFPICGDVEFAGKGDPVFCGDKEGVGYPFFVELYNPVAVSENLLVACIGKVNPNDLRELKEMLNSEAWRKEESEYVWKFRVREINHLSHYRKTVPLRVKVAVIIKKILHFMKGSVSELPVPWMFDPLPAYRAMRFYKGGKYPDAYIRRLCIFLEDYRRQKKKSLKLVNEALFYLYLLQSKTKRAEKILKEGNLNSKLKELLKKPECRREYIKSNLTKTLKAIYSELEEET